jgi:hypothetical protein
VGYITAPPTHHGQNHSLQSGVSRRQLITGLAGLGLFALAQTPALAQNDMTPEEALKRLMDVVARQEYRTLNHRRD